MSDDYNVHIFKLTTENTQKLLDRAKTEHVPKSLLIAKAVLKYLETKE